MILRIGLVCVDRQGASDALVLIEVFPHVWVRCVRSGSVSWRRRPPAVALPLKASANQPIAEALAARPLREPERRDLMRSLGQRSRSDSALTPPAQAR